METAWKIKAFTLVLALFGVLYGISYLQKGKAVAKLKDVGIIVNQADAAEKPKKSAKATKKEKVIQATHDENTKNDDNHLTWCETRVKSLTTKSGIKIEQEGNTWFTMAPQKKELNQVAMEKWLGEYCTLDITDSRPPTFVKTNDTEMLNVGFINGESQTFTLTPEGFYFYNGLRFRSKEFKEAMEKLAKVANGETL